MGGTAGSAQSSRVVDALVGVRDICSDVGVGVGTGAASAHRSLLLLLLLVIDRGSPGVPLLLFRVDDGTKGGAEGERVGCGVVGVKGFALGENTGVCVADAAAAVAAAFCGEVLRCFSFLRRLSLACLISCKLRSSWRRVFFFIIVCVIVFVSLSRERGCVSCWCVLDWF